MYTYRNMQATSTLPSLDNIYELNSYAIQSQYSASPKMLRLMASFQKRISPDKDIETFFADWFNLLTARGKGLDNYGLILEMSRVIEDEKTSLVLDDDYYRLLLLYKAMANISASTADAQNHLLKELVNTGIGGFPRIAYVLEVGTMVIRWVFEDYLTDTQLAIFKVAGTLARGAGVGWEVYAINNKQVFGFNFSEMQPFNQAPFAADNALIKGRNR